MAYGEKASELEKRGHKVVRLNLGEPDFGAPSDVIASLKHGVNLQEMPYSSALGLPELRQAIAQFYANRHSVDINPKRIVVTAGASAALLLLSAALINEGDEVILGDPSYPCNRRFITSFGGKVVLVPTPAKQHFQLTLNKVKQAWTNNTKGILIASPANPTGTAIAADELARISAFCESKNAWRIVDEIYLNLQLSEQVNHHSGIRTSSVALFNTVLASDENAIVVNSFSKYFGMTGWRLGWCVVPECMIEVMEKLAQNLFICPSTLAQHAALSCFSQRSLQECEQRRFKLIERKRKVERAIQDMGLVIDVPPDGAFYVYINIASTGLKAVEFCDLLLQKYHVAMTPGADFGEHRADQYVRLSFATGDDELDLGLARLKAMVNDL